MVHVAGMWSVDATEFAELFAAGIRGGDLGQEAAHGCGARRTDERDPRLVDPLRVVSVVASPAHVGVEGDAPAEGTFEHRHAR